MVRTCAGGLVLLVCLSTAVSGDELLPTIESEIVRLVNTARRHIVTVTVPEGGSNGAVRSVLTASGLAISDSLIVTAANVVTGAARVEVASTDQPSRPATVIGVDPLGGVALLRSTGVLSSSGERPGPEGSIGVGDLVCLVTSRFENMAGFSVGTVTALRPAGMNGQVTTEIETSTTPIPGSAGATLIDTRGRLVGLVVGRTGRTSNPSTSRDAGVVAVPLHEVLTIADLLRRDGKVQRNWLGVSVQEMTPALRDILGIQSGVGVIVIGVDEESPALKAGLELGDVILECSRKLVKGPSELMEVVASASAGARLRLRVFRNGEEFELPVVLVELPLRETQASAAPEVNRSHEARLRALEDEVSRLKAALERSHR